MPQLFPEWVQQLQQGITQLLCSEYQQAAYFTFNDDFLFLEFPQIDNHDLDLSGGITRALSHYGGAMSKDGETGQYVAVFQKPKNIPHPVAVEHFTATVNIQSNPTTMVDYTTTTNKTAPCEVKKIMSNQNNQQPVSEKIVNMSFDEFDAKTRSADSSYVSKANSKIGDIFTITAPFYFVENTFEGKTKIDMMLKVVKGNESAEMKIRLNKDNRGNLVPTFGRDSAGWTGKKIRILNMKTWNIGGKTVEAFVYAPA
jgi:hypothetical protein